MICMVSTLEGVLSSKNKAGSILCILFMTSSFYLPQAGAGTKTAREDESGRLPFLKQWFRTADGIVLHLTNGTLQVRLGI